MTKRLGVLILFGVALLPLVGCSDDEGPTGPAGRSVSERLRASLHYTTDGMAYFYSSATGGFESLTGVPYDDLSCKNCHVNPATCTTCHADEEGGDTPADAKCTDACHGRQKAEAALGFSDVHRTAGLKCANCHSGDDVHGDGSSPVSMLQPGVIQAKCQNCHVPAALAPNAYHQVHGENMDCSACHTQTVVTCYNCHFESEVNDQGKIPFGQFRNWKFLVRRTLDGKIAAANLMTLTYQGKAHIVFAPYYAHTVSRSAIGSCGDCHGNAAVQEYRSSGRINVVTWSEAEKRLVPRTGIVPVPPDWKTSLRFAFATIDSALTTPGQRVWKQVVPTQLGQQMLFAEPLGGVPE